MELVELIIAGVVGLATIAGAYFTYKQYKLGKKKNGKRQSRTKSKTEIETNKRNRFTALERIQKEGKLRCAFTYYPPYSYKEGGIKPVGIVAEISKEFAKRLNVELDCVEEVIWSNMIDGLINDKYDIVSYVWKTREREKLADFLSPLDFGSIGVYVRKDDKRFKEMIPYEKLHEKFNKKSVKIRVLESEISEVLAKSMFPKASIKYVPNYSKIYQLISELASGRSDVAFVEPHMAASFLKKYPDGNLKEITNKRINQPGSFMIKKGSDDLKNCLNMILNEMQNEGLIKKLLLKYGLK